MGSYFLKKNLTLQLTEFIGIQPVPYNSFIKSANQVGIYGKMTLQVVEPTLFYCEAVFLRGGNYGEPRRFEPVQKGKI